MNGSHVDAEVSRLLSLRDTALRLKGAKSSLTSNAASDRREHIKRRWSHHSRRGRNDNPRHTVNFVASTKSVLDPCGAVTKVLSLRMPSAVFVLEFGLQIRFSLYKNFRETSGVCQTCLCLFCWPPESILTGPSRKSWEFLTASVKWTWVCHGGSCKINRLLFADDLVLLKYLGSLLWGEASRIIKTLLKIVTSKGFCPTVPTREISCSLKNLQTASSFAWDVVSSLRYSTLVFR